MTHLRATGIGDLHLDGHYAADVPDYNQRVVDDCRRIIDAGLRKGITNVFLYGDLGHRSTLSEDAVRCLVRLFQQYVQDDVKFFIIKGNHEDRAPGESALDHLVWTMGLLPADQQNVRFFLYEPETVTIDGLKVRFLPYPHTDTKANMLNVLHADAEGAKHDNGHPVKGGFKPHHFSVVGHVHTAQVVGNAHYSGTIYQTRFGESGEKFYHRISWTGTAETSQIKMMAFAPSIVLRDVVLKTEEDLHAFCESFKQDDGVYRLTRLYVNDAELQLKHDALDGLPGIVKRLDYSTKKELKALRYDSALEEEDGEENTSPLFNVGTAFQRWMKHRDVDADLQHRAMNRLQALLPQLETMEPEDDNP